MRVSAADNSTGTVTDAPAARPARVVVPMTMAPFTTMTPLVTRAAPPGPLVARNRYPLPSVAVGAGRRNFSTKVALVALPIEKVLGPNTTTVSAAGDTADSRRDTTRTSRLNQPGTPRASLSRVVMTNADPTTTRTARSSAAHDDRRRARAREASDMSADIVRGAVGLHITRQAGLSRETGQGTRMTSDQPVAASRPKGGAALTRCGVHAALNPGTLGMDRASQRTTSSWPRLPLGRHYSVIERMTCQYFGLLIKYVLKLD